MAVPILRYYDINKPVNVQSDSSQAGLWCCLLQEGQLVAFASLAFQSDADRAKLCADRRRVPEHRVCLTTLPLLPIWQEWYVTAETDHRPLFSIFSQPLHQCTKALAKHAPLSTELLPCGCNAWSNCGCAFIAAPTLAPSLTHKGRCFTCEPWLLTEVDWCFKFCDF